MGIVSVSGPSALWDLVKVMHVPQPIFLNCPKHSHEFLEFLERLTVSRSFPVPNFGFFEIYVAISKALVHARA